MFKYLLLLSALGLALARPNTSDLYEPSKDCPPHAHHLLSHESDCTKFYYCEYGLKYILPRDCSPGTAFSYEHQVCVHPALANCTLSTISTTDSDEGTTEPDSVPVTGSSSQTPAVTSTPTEENSDITANPIQDLTTTPQPEVEYLENGCPADFDVHILLPHETACDKFYYCVRGEMVERECALGTYFNPDIQVCDWPQNVNCTSSPDEDDEPVDGEDECDPEVEIDEETPDVETDEETPDVLPNGCPKDFDVHALLPHETDCDKFYYCVLGDKVERPCANGTFFNYEIQVCDWPWNVDCTPAGNDTDVTNPENGNGGCGGAGKNDDDNDNDGCGNGGNDETVSTLPNGCPADIHVHQLLPHESNCSRFYYCVFGEKVERDCAPGTNFNPAEQVCDWPWNAGCESADSDSEGDYNDNGEGDGNSEDNGNGGDDGNSGDDGNGGDDENCGDGEAVEILPNGCPADFDVHQLLPHETNCSRFYYCVLGEKVERECAPGTHFSSTLQGCDWIWNAGCESGDNGNGNDGDAGNDDNDESDCDNGDSGNGDNGESDGDSGDTGNGDGDNGDSDGDGDDNGTGDNGDGNGDNGESDGDNGDSGNCDNGNGESDGDNGTGGNGEGNGENGGDSETDNKCKDGCNVLPWAHKSDCDKYWYCKDGTPTLIVCSEGLHFNTNTYTCDFICNAGCVREDVQTTVGADGVKVFLPWDKVDNTLIKRLIKHSLN